MVFLRPLGFTTSRFIIVDVFALISSTMSMSPYSSIGLMIILYIFVYCFLLHKVVSYLNPYEKKYW